MKLKIVLVNNQHYYGGGNGTDYLNTAALLREKGHEVAFFAMAGDKNLLIRVNIPFRSPFMRFRARIQGFN